MPFPEPLPLTFGYLPSETEVGGTPLVYEDGLVAGGVDLLLEQFRGKPRIEALLGVFLGQLQHAETAWWQLLVERHLDTASGAALDQLGAIVGESRDGRSDAAYRPFLRARIRVNRSFGRPEDLLDVLRLLLGEGHDVRLVEQPPAAVVIRIQGPLSAPGPGPRTVVDLLQQARAAGVRLTLEYVTAEPAASFALGRASAPSSSAATGLGSTTDSDLGGALAGAME